MWQVNYLCSNLGKLPLKIIPNRKAFPIVSNNHFIKFVLSPRCKPIFINWGNNFIDTFYRFYNFYTLVKRDDWQFLFLMADQFISRYTTYQIITLFFGSPKYIEMSNMKHIKYTHGIAYFVFTIIHTFILLVNLNICMQNYNP